MKAFFILFLTLGTLPALASIPLPPPGTQPSSSVPKVATSEERTLICEAIQKYTKENGTDFALDYKACLKTTTLQSKFFSTVLVTDIYMVSGALVFNAPGRPSYQAQCKITYFGAASTLR